MKLDTLVLVILLLRVSWRVPLTELVAVITVPAGTPKPPTASPIKKPTGTPPVVVALTSTVFAPAVAIVFTVTGENVPLVVAVAVAVADRVILVPLIEAIVAPAGMPLPTILSPTNKLLAVEEGTVIRVELEVVVSVDTASGAKVNVPAPDFATPTEFAPLFTIWLLRVRVPALI